MSLESLPLPFDDATHKELDKAVNDKTTRLPNGPLELIPLLQLLLHYIVENSNKELDRKYLLGTESEDLIDNNKELQEMLSRAWEKKSYRDIRNLVILRSPNPPQKQIKHSALEYENQSLSSSFRAKYYGAAADGFYEYLTSNETFFGNSNSNYYAKFCAIVQSSGTGKSRMLTELGKKDVIVVYMNICDKTDTTSFPPRDRIPADILTGVSKYMDEKVYEVICYAFFVALFDTIERCVSHLLDTNNPKEAILDWGRQMCVMSYNPVTARRVFFERFKENYDKTYRALTNVGRSPASATPKGDNTGVKTTDEDVDETAKQLGGLSVSDPTAMGIDVTLYNLLVRSFGKLSASLARTFPKHSFKPKLVIAIDEAYSLAQRAFRQEVRPADVFCRVVREYSHCRTAVEAVWVVFASTNSKVVDFSPPNKLHDSGRIAIHGEKLFPPYTQLGWDQNAPSLDNVDVENVSLAAVIAGYGRPLWLSLRNVGHRSKDVLDLASEKLCGGKTWYNPAETDQVLAVLGQRFAVNVTFWHPDSVQHLEKGVASHLRVCLATTPDRSWRFTSYPSEPFLSCVAATNLHKRDNNLERSLGKLLDLVNRGMVDVGQHGELASRLLWLLAKDLFVRKVFIQPNVFPSQWNEHLTDCKMIPVVDWLEFVFGEDLWGRNEELKNAAHNAFENAFLNFSHWVCMDTILSGSGIENELSLDEFTLRHWKRTSAVQCCQQQPMVDKMIPMYFRDKSIPSTKERMSQIFISDKASKSRRSDHGLHNITRKNPNVGAQDWRLPYITILADLGQPTNVEATFSVEGTSDPCLRIYTGGVTKKQFPFLGHCSMNIAESLYNLVYPTAVPKPTEQLYTKYLDAQVKFGSSPSPEHMNWEHGKGVPTLPGPSTQGSLS